MNRRKCRIKHKKQVLTIGHADGNIRCGPTDVDCADHPKSSGGTRGSFRGAWSARTVRVTSGDGRTVQVTALGRACEACAEGVLGTKIGCEKQLICGANSLREFGRMPDFPRGTVT